MRTFARIDTVPKDTIPLETIPNGYNPKWTQPQMDIIPNGHNSENLAGQKNTNPQHTPAVHPRLYLKWIQS